jgi:hypothetical protein
MPIVIRSLGTKLPARPSAEAGMMHGAAVALMAALKNCRLVQGFRI